MNADASDPARAPRTILVVDDQASMRTLVSDYLAAGGFRVVAAENGRAALAVARDERPDLILLDVMMPQLDGFEFLRTYRKERTTPVIILTARLAESDKVVGLEIGADDYVTKPFGLRELVARIHAVLRRAAPDGARDDTLRAADIVLDRAVHTVDVTGRRVELTPSEFDLLAVLMTSPGRVFTRPEILAYLQGPLAQAVPRTVDVHVRNLRAKIEADPTHPRYVETVFGVGYRFRAE
jgi:DNA-binding response OmpR family regulator